MVSALAIWPLMGVCFGGLLGWYGIGAARLVAWHRSEGWFIAGADVVGLLVLFLSGALTWLTGVIINTPYIDLSRQEINGYIFGVCAFVAAALISMVASLSKEVMRRRALVQQQRPSVEAPSQSRLRQF